MSSSARAYVVIGVKFDDIGQTYTEERELVRFHPHSGQPYTVTIQQTVVEVLGEKIPDEPDPVSPVWAGFGGDNPRRGTKPGHNLYMWLKSRDARWGTDGDDYGDGGVKVNLDILGIQVARAYQGSCTRTIGEVGDITEQRKLAEELLRAIGYTGEVKVYVVAELS
jgi:hypothetical protein